MRTLNFCSECGREFSETFLVHRETCKGWTGNPPKEVAPEEPRGPIVTWRGDGKEYYHSMGALSVKNGQAETFGKGGLDDCHEVWPHWRMATPEEIANQGRLYDEMMESWKRPRKTWFQRVFG